jgi:hypothetical protein
MADDLRLNKIGKKEFWFYSVVFVGGYVLAIAGDTFYPSVYSSPFVEFFYQLIFVFGELLTFYIAYTANKEGDNEDFLYRMISLTFPIVVLLLPIILVLIGLGYVTGFLDINVYGHADNSILLLVTVFALYLTKKYMTRAATGQ